MAEGEGEPTIATDPAPDAVDRETADAEVVDAAAAAMPSGAALPAVPSSPDPERVAS